jgi:Coenzyme PQQ synthesis protein D (PqqD)
VQPLTPSSLVVRNPEPLTASVDDEIVMLDARQGAYFGLDPTGSAIWELIERPISIDALCASLVERYDIDRDTCLADVTAFLTQLLDAELVAVPHRSGV